MKKSIFTLTILLVVGVLTAQPDCDPPINSAYLHGNEVRAYLSNSGSLFFDGDEAQFEVPFGNDIHTIFAQGLWLGGIDPGGNIKMAAQTYGLSSGSGDYFSGPLDEENGMTTAVDCSNWDKIWCVARYEIESHISDFEDNGVIDNPIPAIMSWPGKGNPQFESINGFDLPGTPQGLAPYQDVNADGVYNPMDGDYPRIFQSEILPEQICWNVFNDAGNIHSETGGEPVQVEVQLTSWAFNCQDNAQLNQTVFLSYKLINRALEPLDSVFMGLWHDFDLGCYTDDYVGYDEASNSVFVYNQDAIDGENAATCPGGVNTYGNNPPAQAATFLNYPLAYGMYYQNGGLGGPPGMSDANTVQEIYNYLTGRWRDGSPLEFGGDGYQEGTFPTNIAFPDDPNDADGWSAVSANLPDGDRRTVSSIALPMWQPGAVIEVDVAYSFFREENGSHLSNVTAMYAGLEDLQNWYQSGFAGVCSTSAICESDCVWPGDLNADGIANYCDLIPLGQEYDQSGFTRAGPYNWAPYDGQSWGSSQSNGSDVKHLDANGDGALSTFDFDLTELHYGFTVPGYSGETVVVESSENGLYLEPVNGSFEDVEAGTSFFVRVGIEGYEPLSALAFSMEYDPLYIENISVLNGSASSNELYYSGNHPELGGMHFATYAFEADDFIESGDFLTINIKFSEELADIEVPSDETLFRFANTKGLNGNGEEVIIESQSQVVTFTGLTISDTEEASIAKTAVKVFPNPAKGVLNVQSEQPMLGQLQVFNTAGQLMESLNAQGQQQRSLNLQALPAGLYFLRVQTAEGLTVKRFVKE